VYTISGSNGHHLANQQTVELPEYFKEYCPKPYDQNEYKIVFNNGKAITFPDYEMMRNFWWKKVATGQLSHVIIVDKVQKKAPVKGF
jgi:hypothetical protein